MKCPICKKKSVTRYIPFCSKKCADVDLFRWFEGSYRLSSDEEPSNDEYEGFKHVRKPD